MRRPKPLMASCHAIRPIRGMRAAALCLSLLSPAGCGLGSPTPDAVCTEYADNLNKLADKLDAISSTAHSDAAISEIRELVMKTNALGDESARVEADEHQQLSPEVEQELARASDRVRTAIARVQDADLLTERLRTALDEARLAQESFLASAKAGQLPAPETPLEQAVVELISLKGQFAEELTTIQNTSTAQAAVDRLSNLWDEEYATLQRMAGLGAESPPAGIPPKYADHFRVVTKRVEQADARLNGLAEIQQITTALAPALEHAPFKREDPFRIDATIRQAGSGRIVTVKLLNKQELQGPRHQRMVQMLAEAAGGANHEALINDDGYHIVLSPVENLDAFIRAIGFGQVSDVNHSALTFTLALDPSQIPETGSEAIGGAGPERRPFGSPGMGPAGEGPRTSVRPEDLIRAQKHRIARETGSDNTLAVRVVNGRALPRQSGPVMAALRRIAINERVLGTPIGEQDLVFVLATDQDIENVAALFQAGRVDSLDRGIGEIVLRVD